MKKKTATELGTMITARDLSGTRMTVIVTTTGMKVATTDGTVIVRMADRRITVAAAKSSVGMIGVMSAKVKMIAAKSRALRLLCLARGLRQM